MRVTVVTPDTVGTSGGQTRRADPVGRPGGQTRWAGDIAAATSPPRRRRTSRSTPRGAESCRYAGPVTWQRVLDVVDAIESWIAGQSYWVQVVVLLAVLGPLCWLLAGLIDRVVEAVLAWHSRRDQAAAGLTAAGSAGGHPSAAGQRTKADP
jgi:hypothetical protein